MFGILVFRYIGILGSNTTTLVEWDTICRQNGRFLPPECANRMAELTETILMCMNCLYTMSMDLGRRLYQLIPKIHMFAHLGYDFCFQANPRRVHAYSDEDLVGKIKRIAERCHAGTVAFRAVQRYAIMICIRWWLQLAILRGLD